MRVVAGTARGRKLIAPAGHDVRPTADRVRQATFNALESRGALDGARVLDLFAGTGALGIEALSRGAAHLTAVERDPKALSAIGANLASTGFADRATVVRQEVLAWLARQPRGTLFDLVLADPPYEFDRWHELLSVLADRELVERDTGLVVIETSAPVEVAPPWAIVRAQRYGSTVVSIAAFPSDSLPHSERSVP